VLAAMHRLPWGTTDSRTRMWGCSCSARRTGGACRHKRQASKCHAATADPWWHHPWTHYLAPGAAVQQDDRLGRLVARHATCLRCHPHHHHHHPPSAPPALSAQTRAHRPARTTTRPSAPPALSAQTRAHHHPPSAHSPFSAPPPGPSTQRP